MKIVCMAVMMLAAATEAHVFTTAKLQWMQSKGVNLNSVAESKANMHKNAAHVDRRVAKSRKISHARLEAYNHRLSHPCSPTATDDCHVPLPGEPGYIPPPCPKESGDCKKDGTWKKGKGPEDVTKDGKAKDPNALSYKEEMIYGLIDGTTADYNTSCRDALKTTVNGSFRVWQYKMVQLPQNTAKFQLSMTQFTSGTSNVYAYCDFTAMYTAFAELLVFSDYEQYITLSSRYMGAKISDLPRLKECVTQGKLGKLGYDVGLCRGKMFTTIMDLTL